jgi:hypothetical protein
MEKTHLEFIARERELAHLQHSDEYSVPAIA